MDTSGCIVYPFCCAGFLISAVSAQVLGSLLSKGQLLAEMDEYQRFFIKIVIFIIGLAITYAVISFIFRDLYVM